MAIRRSSALDAEEARHPTGSDAASPPFSSSTGENAHNPIVGVQRLVRVNAKDAGGSSLLVGVTKIALDTIVPCAALVAHVLVRLRCNVSHQEFTFCVRVNRGVPEELRCKPSGGGGSGGTAPVCGECSSLLQGDRLSRRVDELVRRGRSDHVKAGAVIVTC